MFSHGKRQEYTFLTSMRELPRKSPIERRFEAVTKFSAVESKAGAIGYLCMRSASRRRIGGYFIDRRWLYCVILCY